MDSKAEELGYYRLESVRNEQTIGGGNDAIFRHWPLVPSRGSDRTGRDEFKIRIDALGFTPTPGSMDVSQGWEYRARVVADPTPIVLEVIALGSEEYCSIAESGVSTKSWARCRLSFNTSPGFYYGGGEIVLPARLFPFKLRERCFLSVDPTRYNWVEDHKQAEANAAALKTITQELNLTKS